MSYIEDEDKGLSLHQLSVRHQASIISQLVDIGRDGNQQEHIKFLSFIRRLECLWPNGDQLRRTWIDAFTQQNYLALSYTWEPSKDEDSESGRYTVEDWDKKDLKPSTVRNCVLSRILSYMRYVRVPILWIDAHCIRQDTCGIAGGTHPNCTQKRDALETMDLVYGLSRYPVALLGRPLQAESEMHLLAKVLSGDFVNETPLRLSRANTIDEAWSALQLVYKITRDAWWTRAWTFQENYRGGKKMRLLIAHDSSLEQLKRRLKVFGNKHGEIRMFSVAFSTEATRLCLALRRVAVKLPPNEVYCIDAVIRAAGRYALVLPESSAMTPTVVADIESRSSTKPWDRLAILANCCQYSVRLDGEALRQQGHSLSLSTLAMCLLNGEILNNADDDLKPENSLRTSEFLEKYILKVFGAPTSDSRHLTFNKGCRLTNVELKMEGILTMGHLWKLSHIIYTSRFRPRLPQISRTNGRLTKDQRRRLLQLVFYLYERGYSDLAKYIDDFLAADADAEKGYVNFTDMYFHRMAVEVATAIQEGRKLRLGSIWDPTRRSPYRAVFVWCDEETFESRTNPAPAYVFTSAWYRDPGSDTHDANDIDRHVSIQVDHEGRLSHDSVPKLRTRRWRLGMCFFERCPRTEVVFPWPRPLQAVKA